jgi:hypothetical protein
MVRQDIIYARIVNQDVYGTEFRKSRSDQNLEGRYVPNVRFDPYRLNVHF